MDESLFVVIIEKVTKPIRVIGGFKNETEAIDYLKEIYLKEVQTVKVLDYDKTYIDKECKSARIAAGIHSTNLYVTNITRRINKLRKP